MLNIIEQWKTIEDFPNYLISNLGQVKNLKNHTIKSWKNNSGYSCVTLYTKSKQKQNVLVHRLVAHAFIPNFDVNNLEVNHLDGNKQNNKVSNLEWITRSKNMLHAYKTNLKECPYSTQGKKITREGKKPTSLYHGVCWDNSRQKWHSGVVFNKKVHKQKRFKTEIEAAEHYNKVVLEMNLQDILPLNIIKCPTTSL